MGDGDPEMIQARRAQAERVRSLSALYAVMAGLLFLIVLQFLLLTIGLEGFLGTKRGVILPSAAASGLCFAASCWLIRYVSAPRGGNFP